MRALLIALVGVVLLNLMSLSPATANSRSLLMIYTHNRDTYALALSGGQPRALGSEPAQTYSWSHDGKFLLAEVTGKTPRLEILSAAGRTVRKLPGDVSDLLAAGWDRDSDRLLTASLVASGHGRVWTVFSVAGLRGPAKRLWPRHLKGKTTPVVVGSGLSNYYPSFGDPAAAELKGELLTSGAGLLYSSKQHVVIYAKPVGADASRPWRVLNLKTGAHWTLPFGNISGALGASGLFSGGPVDTVVLSRSGFLAGDVGDRIGIIGLYRHDKLRLSDQGYDPAWSADGRYLYFVSSHRATRLTFSMRVKVPGIFTCLRHGKLDLKHCIAGRHPFRRVWIWQPVKSVQNTVSVERVSSLGRKPMTLMTQDGYGIADLNVLPGNSRLIFSIIPSDTALWMHRSRKGTIDARDSKKYRPFISIESWSFGEAPVLLIQHGHLPAVQPFAR